MDAFNIGNFFEEVDTKAVDAGRVEAQDPDAPIPDGTRLPVIAERIGYTDDLDTATLNVMWRVTGGPHAPRVIFQKLLLAGSDKWAPEKSENKRRRARTQLMVMVRLTGANRIEQVLRSGKLPADSMLSECICGKPMEITVGTWEFEGNDGKLRKGNWVKAVGSRDEATAYAPKTARGFTNEDAAKPYDRKNDAVVTEPREAIKRALPNDDIPW